MTGAPVAAIPARVAPWYRNGWPWALMAGPAFVIVGGAYATWLAASTSDGLVADDYYKRGVAINRTLSRSEHAARIGLVGALRIDADGEVRLALSRADGMTDFPAQVQLRIVHPTRAGQDRVVALVRQGADVYIGRVDPPGPGRRHAVAESDSWRVSGDFTAGTAVDIRLATASAE